MLLKQIQLGSEYNVALLQLREDFLHIKFSLSRAPWLLIQTVELVLVSLTTVIVIFVLWIKVIIPILVLLLFVVNHRTLIIAFRDQSSSTMFLTDVFSPQLIDPQLILLFLIAFGAAFGISIGLSELVDKLLLFNAWIFEEFLKLWCNIAGLGLKKESDHQFKIFKRLLVKL